MTEFPVLTELLKWGLPILIPLVAFVFIALLKDEIREILKGIAFRRNKHFNEDDLVYLEGRKARIVSIGLTTTRILMFDKNTIRIFRNSYVEKLKLEKILKDFNGETKG